MIQLLESKNLANYLSISRIFLSIIFAYYLYTLNSCYDYLFILFIVIMLTDIFDGRIARYTGNVSSYGAKLDVYCDLFFVASSYISLYFKGIMPLFFIIIVSFKFLEFIITSHILDNKIVYDNLGKYTSIIWIVLPGLVVFLLMINFKYALLINIITTITSVTAFISSVNRINKYFKKNR